MKTQIQNTLLHVAFVPEVVYIPAHNGSLGGLYDSNFNPIPQAVSYQGKIAKLSQSIENKPDFNSLPLVQSDVPYFFMGVINPHFGHFLLESTARLWPLLYLQHSFKGKYLYCNQHISNRLFAKSFIKDIFGGFSLKADDFVNYDKACRLKNVFVAPPAFEICLQGHPIFRQTMQHVGNRLIDNLDGIKNSNLTPIYLSKSKLTRGLSCIVNEDAIEEKLRKEGVDIWHPETVNFSTQIKELSSRKYIIGTLSSAFHTLICCPGEKNVSAVVTGRDKLSSYTIIDELCGNAGSYIFYPEMGINKLKNHEGYDKPGIKNLFYASKPERVAETLLRNLHSN
jgi:hypothetical protein